MKYLLTGATGYIGTQLAQRLAAQGHTVHALYRSESKLGNLNQVENIHFFKGDILDVKSLELAVEGCDAVFHVAAFAKPWHKDPQTFFRLNVKGAENVFQTAKRAGVKRVVFTSTAGVISPSDGTPSDENTARTIPLSTLYEKSKAEAEELAKSLNSSEMEIVTVNPSRVYGPGLLSDSNGVTRMVKLYLEGKFRFLPGDGRSIGNYVFIWDVVDGHLQAMEHGRGGERYILGGDNASFREFFDLLAKVSGKKVRLFKLPIPLMNMAAQAMEWRANWTGAPPLITPPFVKKYSYNWDLSSAKAEMELGYQPKNLEQGLAETVDWLVGSRNSNL